MTEGVGTLLVAAVVAVANLVLNIVGVLPDWASLLISFGVVIATADGLWAYRQARQREELARHVEDWLEKLYP